MAPPNNDPSPMNFSQDEGNGYTTGVRPKQRYFNSNNNNRFSDNNNNKDSSSWTPRAVPPVPIHSPTSTATGHTLYPNSRLRSRVPLSDDYSTPQQPVTNTNTNNSAPLLPVASHLSNENNEDKNDDDENKEYVRDVNIFLNYVREVDPVPVPLSDRYDGGSIHDLDNGSGSSIEDLIKDGFDDSNENHWIDAKTMVLKDKFPKAHFHVLVMPTRVCPTFDDLICDEGVMIVKQLVERAEIIIARESKRSPYLRFKMGFHALPSMTQVHMHVISTDMDSDNTYTISVYNSYTTESFLTPDQVIRNIESKWKARDMEFLTTRNRAFYNGWNHYALTSCLLCPIALTGAVDRRLHGHNRTQKCRQRQRERQRQASSSHKHADPDMDAALHKTPDEIYVGGGIVTATTIGASLVPYTIVKDMETQPSSTVPTATDFTAPAASQQDVWKSTIIIGDNRVSWDDRYADFELLRKHLREHYLEQKRMYFSSSSSPPSLSPLSLSPDCDLDNHDHEHIHDLNDDQSITFTAQNIYDDNDDDDKSGHNEDEDVLSSTTVPLLLIHGALDA
ncbi:hypothetical protein KI688_006761 [Linnemannia hyalina]|uniref:HIT-like protein n=1 Tax=Linnemannia hyalina TaxID=64524 RepID=A0A9P7XLC1_9FUNG|nr:hypothetical protein KI688_006761 [Linnemannia hyalina]